VNIVAAVVNARAEEYVVGVSATAAVLRICDCLPADGLGCPTVAGTDDTASAALAARKLWPLDARWSAELSLAGSSTVTSSFSDAGSAAGISSAPSPLVGSTPSASSVSSSAGAAVSAPGPSDEPDGDSGFEGDESVLSDRSVDADSLSVDEEDLFVDEESLVDDESDGFAYATGGVLAMAKPTPRVTANAPMRPM
jgi:hypothetical protein